MSAARSGATYDGTRFTPDPPPSMRDSSVASRSSLWNLSQHFHFKYNFYLIYLNEINFLTALQHYFVSKKPIICFFLTFIFKLLTAEIQPSELLSSKSSITWFALKYIFVIKVLYQIGLLKIYHMYNFVLLFHLTVISCYCTYNLLALLHPIYCECSLVANKHTTTYI